MAIGVADLRLGTARAGCRMLSLLLGRRPVPLRAMLALRRLGGRRDALLPAWASETMALGPAGLDFLGKCLRRSAPSTVLEFGSGDSTIQMARVLADIHGDEDVHVRSVDQDAGFADQSRARLAAAGLNAVVAHCELVNQPTPDGETLSYDLDEEFMTTLLPAGGPDMVVIDGPSGDRRVRYPVLPLVQPYLAGETPFLLHDGLRDYELGVAALWRRLPGVSVEGVHVLDEGFVAGTAKPPGSN